MRWENEMGKEDEERKCGKKRKKEMGKEMGIFGEEG